MESSIFSNGLSESASPSVHIKKLTKAIYLLLLACNKMLICGNVISKNRKESVEKKQSDKAKTERRG